MGTLPALRWAIAAAAVAASLAGCHVPFVSAGGSGASSTSVPASLNTCTIYAQHYDAEVIVTPGRTSECDTLITNLTGGGMVWAATPNAAHQQALLQQQATVAASAGQAQQVASAQRALETDLVTLQSANSALAGSKSLTGAVRQLKRDYAQEQADYLREQHDSCPAAAGDATTVGQDSATVGSDLNTLTGDVENLQVGASRASRPPCLP